MKKYSTPRGVIEDLLLVVDLYDFAVVINNGHLDIITFGSIKVIGNMISGIKCHSIVLIVADDIFFYLFDIAVVGGGVLVRQSIAISVGIILRANEVHRVDADFISDLVADIGLGPISIDSPSLVSGLVI